MKLKRPLAFGRIASLTLLLSAPCAEARLLPETLLLVQAQLYPLREQPRGYLGRFADQALLIDPDLPAGASISWDDPTQADYDLTMALVRKSGLDGLVLFSKQPDAAFLAGGKCPVKDFSVCSIVSYPRWPRKGAAAAWNPGNLHRHIEMVLRNPRACVFRGKYLVPGYWTSVGNTPEGLAAIFADIRAKYGDRFLFMASVAEVADGGGAFHANGGRMPEALDRRIRRIARDYLRVADGLHAGEVGQIGHAERGERVFDAAFYRAQHAILREVLDEPEFRGRKLFGSGAAVSHINSYRLGHTVAQDGTRTLRASMEIAMAADPDYIQLPEWDEYNENTHFQPTLYGSFSVMRLMRYYSARLKGRTPEPMPGDDPSVPNVIVSYRKALTPGEYLTVELVSVPDGTRRGALAASVELLDENGRAVRSFGPGTLAEDRLDELRFGVDTAELDPMPRALRVAVRFEKDGRPAGTFAEGLHPVDLMPGNAWNHVCARQPLRDLIAAPRVTASVADGRCRASFACGEPIRYAMLCGNGAIQYICGAADSPVSRFREDESNVVFQIDAIRNSYRKADRGNLRYRVAGVSRAEWLQGRTVTAGTGLALPAVYCGQPPAYLRFPRADLATAVLEVDLRGLVKGTIPLARAHADDSFAIGGEQGACVSATRYLLQCRYPSHVNAPDCSFDVPVDAERRSMTYHVQLVTKSGKTWFSKPMVVEPQSAPVAARVVSAATGRAAEIRIPEVRLPQLAYDFSPRAGLVVRPANGERHFCGMLGSSFAPAGLWNRGHYTEGVNVAQPHGANCVPRQTREPDGSWSLAFDGRDDFAAFPWELVSAFGGYTVALDVRPEREDATEGLLTGARSPVTLLNTPRGLAVGYWALNHAHGVKATALRLKTNEWNRVALRHDGDRLTLSANGVSETVAIPLLGGFTTAIALGGALPDGSCVNFKGRMRNFTVDYRRRSLQSVNMRDFGAVGNGVHDDTLATVRAPDGI